MILFQINIGRKGMDIVYRSAFTDVGMYQDSIYAGPPFNSVPRYYWVYPRCKSVEYQCADLIKSLRALDRS